MEPTFLEQARYRLRPFLRTLSADYIANDSCHDVLRGWFVAAMFAAAAFLAHPHTTYLPAFNLSLARFTPHYPLFFRPVAALVLRDTAWAFRA